MEVQVNWLAIVLSSVSAMAIGSLWYSPVLFGKTWEKLIGLKSKKVLYSPAVAMIKAAAMSLLTAFVLSHMIYMSQAFYGYSFMQTGLTTAFWIWAGLVAPFMILQGVFGQDHWKLITINISNQLVTLLAMGAIIGALLG